MVRNMVCLGGFLVIDNCFLEELGVVGDFFFFFEINTRKLLYIFNGENFAAFTKTFCT